MNRSASTPAADRAAPSTPWEHAAWEHHPDGMAWLDAQGVVQAANPAFGAMLGQGPAALAGLPWPALLDLLLSRCRTPGPVAPPLATPQDLTLALADGGTLGLTHRLLPDGCRLVCLRDLRAEAQAERSRGEFLSMAAHELRTPLASLVGFSELLKSRAMSPEKTREMAEIFHRQATALTALIGDLMDLARLDARGSRDFRWRALPVRELIDEALAAASLGHARERVRIEHDDGQALLWADEAKAALAVAQVLKNAERYSPGGGQIRVRTEPMRTNGMAGVQIVVTDAGPGMTRDELNRAFDRFYRGSEAASRAAGTGLGLSLVQSIVQLHGGSVALASQPGQGTELRLWLPSPIGPEEPGADPATHAVQSASNTTHTAGLVTRIGSGANCPRTPTVRARRPGRTSPANLLKGGSDEPDDQRTPSGSNPRAA